MVKKSLIFGLLLLVVLVGVGRGQWQVKITGMEMVEGLGSQINVSYEIYSDSILKAGGQVLTVDAFESQALLKARLFEKAKKLQLTELILKSWNTLYLNATLTDVATAWKAKIISFTGGEEISIGFQILNSSNAVQDTAYISVRDPEAKTIEFFKYLIIDAVRFREAKAAFVSRYLPLVGTVLEVK